MRKITKQQKNALMNIALYLEECGSATLFGIGRDERTTQEMGHVTSCVGSILYFTLNKLAQSDKPTEEIMEEFFRELADAYPKWEVRNRRKGLCKNTFDDLNQKPLHWKFA